MSERSSHAGRALEPTSGVVTRLVLALLIVSACHADGNFGYRVVGDPRWTAGLRERADDRPVIAAIDSLGDVIVCGAFADPTDVGSGLGRPSAFISKRFGSDGAERWTNRLLGLDSMSYVSIGAMAITAQDEIIVAGSFVGRVDFADHTLRLDTPDPPNHLRVFIARYASDGLLLWVHALPSAGTRMRWLWLSIQLARST